jgi:hypothetical protein
MNRDRVFRFELDRRRWLRLGVPSTVAASLPGMLRDAQSGQRDFAVMGSEINGKHYQEKRG